ncbi:probable receptor-like protein kinase At5g20050 isoform X1 [Musa acuminata AAA Group]|uniref:probable receptor-like protein kinase At5g20050 isoform X1 n=1 Tax=Musa acuminata AAA Group TaxID=214697 RepID=UPI0031CE967D
MEAKRAKAVAAAVVVSLLFLLVILWFCLGPSLVFFIVLGLGFAVILTVLAWVLAMYTALDRRQMSMARRSAVEREELRVDYSFLRKVAGLPIKFRIEVLVAATDNFQVLLGSGSSASVFRGILDDGTSVAVKRIDAAERGDREFRAEVSAIASIQHVNLVRLLGYCIVAGGPRFLVYEFVANGSLDKWIFPSAGGDREDQQCLPWALRYRAAVDVAKALSYLHHDCRDCVLHLDVKPENILLDESFRALVTDFGLSKLMGKDESTVLTTIRGTRGYLAPEWIIGTGVSDKSDIYSYGMVLLEMVSGRRNVQLVGGGAASQTKWSYFPRIVNEKVRQGRMMEVVDERLKSGGEPPAEREVRTLVHVALWCIHEKAEARPSMARVVDMLERRIAVDELPLQTEMIISRILASDEPNVLEDGAAGDTRAAAAAAVAVSGLESHLSTSYSLDMSDLSGR